MATREQAIAKLHAWRNQIDAVIAKAAEKPEIINALPDGVHIWKPGTMAAPITYAAGDVRMHEGAPYRCVQAHTHQGEPGWEPSPESALWMQYHGTSVETARPYYMRDATTVYRVDEYMIWTDGSVYRCVQDGANYGPDALPGAWELVASI